MRKMQNEGEHTSEGTMYETEQEANICKNDTHLKQFNSSTKSFVSFVQTCLVVSLIYTQKN